MPLDPEPPIDPLDDTNPSRRIDLNDEPPVSPDDTNPSKSQLMRAVDPSDEPPIAPDDTNPSKSQLMRAVDNDEPPLTLDDTNPSRLIDPRAPAPVPVWRRMIGVLLLFGALAFTAGALILGFAPARTPALPALTPADVAQQATETPLPTEAPPTDAPTLAPVQPGQAGDVQPTLSAAQAAAILSAPVDNILEDNPLTVVRNPYAPFTIIPDRPRSEVVTYVIEQGDTINGIAEKFGITPESVVWANNRDIVGRLRPGTTINIVPENGVLYRHTGSSTIAEIAARFGLDDPYAVIDSEYNQVLRGLSPDDVPPSGAQIMLVDGEAEQINWNPTVVREGGESGGGGGNFITFAPGDPGSCGRVPNTGGGAFWQNPMSNYTWMRGFTSFHTGVDLAASEGTPVMAANSGRVIFAGWNSWGYGYTVVLAHGPFTTLYGHLSNIYVGCGQDVSAGTTIAATGNTGNSSGPHLHFEIRFNDQPQDPTISIAF